MFENSQSDNAKVESSNDTKPLNAAANFLMIPIRRLVLFARMLKDFNLFSEDDKVNLLKGSAVEIIICSSNTLFDPKTCTFINYLSHDQQSIMDDRILPLDPLLIKLWGEEAFTRTRNFLISMCNLGIDEITSTLLTPVILFSPDRLNVNDRTLVGRLQEKYAMLLRKYINWSHGTEQTEDIYSKLLLQIVNLRSLGLSHSEIIQKLVSTSSVDPLVQEIAVKPEIFNLLTRKTNVENSMNRDVSLKFRYSLSTCSTSINTEIADLDETSSNNTENSRRSDADESIKKRQRSSIDKEIDYENEGLDEVDLSNTWTKRPRLSDNDPVLSPMRLESPSIDLNNPKVNQEKTVNDYKNCNEYRKQDSLHTHRIPNLVLIHENDFMSLPNRFVIFNPFFSLI